MGHKQDLFVHRRQRGRENLLESLPGLLGSCPDMRLGQLLLNALPPGTDLAVVEDDVLLGHLQVFVDWARSAQAARQTPSSHYCFGPTLAGCTEWPFWPATMLNYEGKPSGGRRRPRYCDPDHDSAFGLLGESGLLENECYALTNNQ